jgi:hypothetical protein
MATITLFQGGQLNYRRIISMSSALLWTSRFGKHPQYSGGSVICNIFVFCTGENARDV